MLPSKEFAPFAPKLLGEQIHINHTACGDTKKRLYIKRVEGGVLGYCHNCGKGGRSYERGHTSDALRGWLEEDRPPVVVSRSSPTPVEYTTRHKLHDAFWLRQALPFIQTLAYKDGTGLLIKNNTNAIVGTVVRTFSGKPKYITYYIEKACSHYSSTVGLSSIVLVEDIVSALYLEALGYNSIALLGTHLRKEDELFLKQKEVILWLDADDAGVRASRAINARLTYLGSKLTTIHHKQPKDLNSGEIRKVLSCCVPPPF